MPVPLGPHRGAPRVHRRRNRTILTSVWGLNPSTGNWDGPFPLGWIPAKYCVIRWKYRGQIYQKNRCG